jgi:TRAP-type C4-dicarboxylate transport system permease small subunit
MNTSKSYAMQPARLFSWQAARSAATWPLDGLNWLGALWLLALMALICADVIGRSIFNSPITGVAEVAGFSVVAIAFLQLPRGVLAKRMTRTDLLIGPLTRHRPRIAYALEAAYTAVGAFIFYIIAYASYPFFMTALARSESYGVPGIWTLPTWPVRLIILAGAAITLVVYVGQTLMYLAAVVRPEIMGTAEEEAA